ncbi:MAG: hypothetical protein A3B37_02585 [Candidatus Sungbacteria bacterium RIFCSPLOWO2_01_FULL_59_16]|uniref:Cell division protein FtsL n=1 Tax=Candidatus Sungbacteria bacterium RIFCSPLOWO2_01_FULL_59_16 TaxID=1802280 RepID=A0A1G2LAQ3_9BACT|nr:MAG: hypothetical protein A3B37_02585 [Candidatus Sungbacteria bacterium RIFCSPLOWO2_01_FULL_59_16]
MRILPDIPRGRQLLVWPPTLVLLAVAVVFLGTSAARISIRAFGILREEHALAVKIRILESEKARLEETIRRLETPEAVERLAKEQLNLKRPGEEVVVVVPEERSTSTPAEKRLRFSELLPSWLGQLLDFLTR